MKKYTPFKRLDKYAFNHARFSCVEDAQQYIRENGAGDYIATLTKVEHQIPVVTVEFHKMSIPTYIIH